MKYFIFLFFPLNLPKSSVYGFFTESMSQSGLVTLQVLKRPQGTSSYSEVADYVLNLVLRIKTPAHMNLTV